MGSGLLQPLTVIGLPLDQVNLMSVECHSVCNRKNNLLLSLLLSDGFTNYSLLDVSLCNCHFIMSINMHESGACKSNVHNLAACVELT